MIKYIEETVVLNHAIAEKRRVLRRMMRAAYLSSRIRQY